jgi:hypothetical protein
MYHCEMVYHFVIMNTLSLFISLRLLPFSYIKTGKKGVEIWVEKVLTRFLKHQTKLVKVLTFVSACFSQDFGRQVPKKSQKFQKS